MAKELDDLFESGQELDQVFEKGQDVEAPKAEAKSPAQEKPSTTAHDFGKGVHQGMMLGGADELGGLGSAIGQTAGESDLMTKLADWYYAQKQGMPVAEVPQEVSPEKKSFYEKYRAAQQAEEQGFKDAQNASPWAYGTGQVLGGLVPGIATGGAAKAAPMATAIAGGGISGALGSDATIEQPLDLAMDTGIGATAGAALQKILPGGAPKPQKDILKRGEFLPQLETAKELGEQGISLSSKPEARQALTNRLQQSEKEIADKFIEPRKTLGKEIEQSLKDASFRDAPPMKADFFDTLGNVSAAIESNIPAIGTKRGRELLLKVDSLKRGLLSPSETHALQKELQEVARDVNIPELQSIVKTGVREIRSGLEEAVPGYTQKLKDFAQFAEKGPESLLSKGFDSDIADVFLGDMNKGNLKIAEKVRGLLNTIRSGGKEGLQKQGEFFNAMEQLKSLANENPELVKKLGIDPAKLTKDFIGKADEAAVALKTAGKSLPEAGIERGVRGIRAIGEEAVLKGANKYGLAKRSMKNFVSAGKEEMASYANALKEHGGPDLQGWGQALEDAVKAGDIRKQNAAIFSIMQLPKAKDILNIGEEEGE